MTNFLLMTFSTLNWYYYLWCVIKWNLESAHKYVNYWHPIYINNFTIIFLPSAIPVKNIAHKIPNGFISNREQGRQVAFRNRDSMFITGGMTLAHFIVSDRITSVKINKLGQQYDAVL